MFNNEKEGDDVFTTYYFPVINKSFQYKHTNKDQREIKRFIIGTINPKIKWQMVDTIRAKKDVLYTSEVKLK